MNFKISARNRKQRARRRRGVKAEKAESGKGGEGVRFYKWTAIPEEQRDPRRYFWWWEKMEVWNRQLGRCARSKERLDPETVEFDHVIPWAAGGPTSIDNCEALTPEAHRKKSKKEKIKQLWN